MTGLRLSAKAEWGALSYEPESFLQTEKSLTADYDEICAECERVLNSKENETDIKNLDELFEAGGSSGGEHATTVNGEGKNPAMKDILKVAEKNGIKISHAKEIADEVENCVQENLGRWLKKL